MWVTSPTSAAYYPPRFHLQMPRCHDQPSCNGRTVSPCFSSNRDKQSAFSGFIKARERPGQENHRQEKTDDKQSAFSGFIKARERPGQENHRQEKTDGDTRTETTPRTKKASETERTKGEEQGIKKTQRENRRWRRKHERPEKLLAREFLFLILGTDHRLSQIKRTTKRGNKEKKDNTEREGEIKKEEEEQERRGRGSREHKKKAGDKRKRG